MHSVADDAFVAIAHPPPLRPDDVHVWHVALDAALKPREITAAAHAVLGRLLMTYANLDAPPAIRPAIRIAFHAISARTRFQAQG